MVLFYKKKFRLLSSDKKNSENRPPSAGPNGLEAIGGDGLGAGLALKGLVAGRLGGNAGLRACICGVNLGLGRN